MTRLLAALAIAAIVALGVQHRGAEAHIKDCWLDPATPAAYWALYPPPGSPYGGYRYMYGVTFNCGTWWDSMQSLNIAVHPKRFQWMTGEWVSVPMMAMTGDSLMYSPPINPTTLTSDYGFPLYPNHGKNCMKLKVYASRVYYHENPYQPAEHLGQGYKLYVTWTAPICK